MRQFEHIALAFAAAAIIFAAAFALYSVLKPIEYDEELAAEVQSSVISYEELLASAESEQYNEEDVELLAKIMQFESGSTWPDQAIMMIGEVVMNRVESPEFPDTIREVLYQENPQQYAPVWTDAWDSTEPGEKYIELAKRLLDGERPINDKSIVFQALFQQGSAIAFMYHDDQLDNITYFCRSSYPELYE